MRRTARTKVQKVALDIDKDFMGNIKKVFRLIGWNPFSFEREDNRSMRLFLCQLIYLIVTNFLIVLGFVHEAIYCVVNIGEPDAFYKITNTLIPLGKMNLR